MDDYNSEMVFIANESLNEYDEITISTHKSLKNLLEVLSRNSLVVTPYSNKGFEFRLKIMLGNDVIGIAQAYRHWDWSKVVDDLDWRKLDSYKKNDLKISVFVLKMVIAPDAWGFVPGDFPRVYKGEILGLKFVIPKEPEFLGAMEFLNNFFFNRMDSLYT